MVGFTDRIGPGPPHLGCSGAVVRMVAVEAVGYEAIMRRHLAQQGGSLGVLRYYASGDLPLQRLPWGLLVPSRDNRVCAWRLLVCAFSWQPLNRRVRLRMC